MKRKNWVTIAGMTALGSSLLITNAFAQSSDSCRAYAEDYSMRYSSPWATSTFRIGGTRAGVSAWAANRFSAQQQAALFRNAYARCMKGRFP